MQSNELGVLLRSDEGQLLEFKREWYDLESRLGKAKFARDVMAMANGLQEGQVGHIVVGREDSRHGGELVGVDEDPTFDELVQILAAATRPVPDIRAHLGVVYDGLTFSIIEVRWSRYHPHYCTRQYDRVLSIDQVVVREGGTTRTLTPPEFETMIRAKDARIGRIAADGPLLVGFVELQDSGRGEGSVLVRNTSEEPVESVSAVLDVSRVFPPNLVHRMRIASPHTIHPGEAREFGFQTGHAHFYLPDGTPVRDDSSIWSRWFDLTLRVRYRGRDGLLREIRRTAALGG